MNYELTMLKNAVRMKRSAASLNREMQRIALKSFDVQGWSNGTMGQLKALSELCSRAQALNDFFVAVKGALSALPAGYRTLLVSVYVKNADRSCIAERFGVSIATVYRKLYSARRMFRIALIGMGCDEQWFNEHYGDFDWISRREQAQKSAQTFDCLH